jgi:fluoroquinolone transport system ATP-binding protein
MNYSSLLNIDTKGENQMITVKNVDFTYPGQTKQALQGINFHIKAGEIFGFLGPSGAGKSTIQKILIGILKQYKGSVQVLGQELRNVDSTYYEQIGVAFEFPNFYSRFTAIENLSLFRSLYQSNTEEPRQLLTRLDLEKHANFKVSEFSKGMKMRLNLCRSLLNKPEVLFLDEPTSGLDPVNTKLVKDIIFQKKAEGKTILITTHNMSIAAEICDQVAFIVDGKVNLISSPKELMLSHNSREVRVEYRGPDRLLHQDFALEGLSQNTSFLKLLQEQQIETIHTQEASLEEIFIQVTGRKLA